MTSWTLRPIRKRYRPPRGRSSQGDLRAPVDEFLDSWVSWREACEDVRGAYERWGVAAPTQRALAFESYRAALAREEQAALVHASSTERLQAGER